MSTGSDFAQGSWRPQTPHAAAAARQVRLSSGGVIDAQALQQLQAFSALQGLPQLPATLQSTAPISAAVPLAPLALSPAARLASAERQPTVGLSLGSRLGSAERHSASSSASPAKPAETAAATAAADAMTVAALAAAVADVNRCVVEVQQALTAAMVRNTQQQQPPAKTPAAAAATTATPPPSSGMAASAIAGAGVDRVAIERRCSDDGYVVSVIEPLEVDDVAARSVSHIVVSRSIVGDFRRSSRQPPKLVKRSRQPTAGRSAVRRGSLDATTGAAPTPKFGVGKMAGSSGSKRQSPTAAAAASEQPATRQAFRGGRSKESVTDTDAPDSATGRHSSRMAPAQPDSAAAAATAASVAGAAAASRLITASDGEEGRGRGRPKCGWLTYILKIVKIVLTTGGSAVSVLAHQCENQTGQNSNGRPNGFTTNFELFLYYPFWLMVGAVMSETAVLYLYVHWSVSSRTPGRAVAYVFCFYHIAWAGALCAGAVQLTIKSKEAGKDCSAHFWSVVVPTMLLFLCEAFANYIWTAGYHGRLQERQADSAKQSLQSGRAT